MSTETNAKPWLISTEPHAVQLDIVLNRTVPKFWCYVVWLLDTIVAKLSCIPRSAMGCISAHSSMSKIGGFSCGDIGLRSSERSDAELRNHDASEVRLHEFCRKPDAVFPWFFGSCCNLRSA